MRRLILGIFICLGVTISISTAQQTTLLKQVSDMSFPTALSSQELAELGDPLFGLALKTPPLPQTLTELEQRLQPVASNRQNFVVSEQIAESDPGQRRMVLSYTGSNAGTPLAGNVMLSIFFDADGFSEAATPIEGWGWDEGRRRYNYYKFDKSPGAQSRGWTFRGSSVGADRLAATARRGTCLACHINGGPIMKELFLPWTNWNSFAFRADYLQPSGAKPWRVAQHDRLSKQLRGAESLEGALMSSITRFNRSRLVSLAPNASGMINVGDARGVLRPVFTTTEFNIISADVESGMHPFRQPRSGQPAADVRIPGSFFINQQLLAQLGITESFDFSVRPAEYAALVNDSKTLFNNVVGDALFAWITPEPSHIDNDYVSQLISKGVVSKTFVASTLIVDLEAPILSSPRESLIQFVPSGFTVGVSSSPTLERLVIDEIRKANPKPGTAAAQFLQALESPDAVAMLRARVQVYRDRIRDALNDPDRRKTELKRLYALLLGRRRAVLDDAQLRVLDETDGLLFPLPR